MEINKVRIQVIPDPSRQTRDRRRRLKPLLEHIRSKGGSYRWGYPFSLTIKRDGEIFNLYDPKQLPKLFQFLGSEAIKVPNWREEQNISTRDATLQRGRSPVGH